MGRGVGHGLPHRRLHGPPVADIIAARLAGRNPKTFTYRHFHECISRRRRLVQFLNADESPKERILTGRKAILYKNTTLNGARLLFRHPARLLARRRYLRPGVQPFPASPASGTDAVPQATARR